MPELFCLKNHPLVFGIEPGTPKCSDADVDAAAAAAAADVNFNEGAFSASDIKINDGLPFTFPKSENPKVPKVKLIFMSHKKLSFGSAL